VIGSQRRQPVASQRLRAEVAAREQEPHEAPAGRTIVFCHVVGNVAGMMEVTVHLFFARCARPVTR
jgi:hypothetical protein